MTLQSRLFLCLVICLLAGVATAIGLVYLIVQNQYDRLSADRLSIVIGAERDRLARELRDGVPINLHRDIDGVLKRAQAANRGVSELLVFGAPPQTTVLFGADATRIGEAARPDWVSAAANLEVSRLADSDGRWLVAGIRDPTGRSVGGIVARISDDWASLAKVDPGLIPVVVGPLILFIALAGLLAWFGARLLAQPLSNALIKTSDALIRARRIDIDLSHIPIEDEVPLKEQNPWLAGAIDALMAINEARAAMVALDENV